ncbi:Os09g0292350 [Oryza sativa Japonica Group]|uniref:Os09g0292350 protein n=1 Tax=Oryza sativa subsp. japonica TaxID=39947 RepID=A0A0P0XK34_ORYSJ|nr:Os09g0292350 [Oryza sativa Japonica Group]
MHLLIEKSLLSFSLALIFSLFGPHIKVPFHKSFYANTLILPLGFFFFFVSWYNNNPSMRHLFKPFRICIIIFSCICIILYLISQGVLIIWKYNLSVTKIILITLNLSND